MNKTLFLVIFFVPTFIFSQTIKGIIKDSLGNNVLFSNVLIKEKSDSSSIVEYTYARDGFYEINLKKKYQSILIEVFSVEYENEYFIIDNPQKDKIYNVDFNFKKNKINNLNEIIVVSEKQKFKIKKDTLIYDIDNYKEPSDRKVQDVLKRLPGIQVNEKSGEIKYKGKSVETVTLDGDNLFGYNYSIGTKNINIDMLDKVEAIDNYSENPLLKGIEGDEKVSLNLKLKKGKTDYSGNLDIGFGTNSEKKILNNTNTNILGISKKYKSFAIFSFNNLGINHSPFDYFSNNRNVEQFRDKDIVAPKIISESLFRNSLDSEKSNLNNMFFSNYNSVFKISNRISLKSNLYYLNDKIDISQKNTNANMFNVFFLTTTDEYNTIKKPKYYRGDFELKYNTSKKSLLEYKTKFYYEKINNKSFIKANSIGSYSSVLNSEEIFFNQKLIFTNKLGNNKALQFQINNAINSAPQKLFLNNLNTTDFENQKSNYRKEFFDVFVNRLGAKSFYKYSFSIGASSDKTPFYSINNLLTTSSNINKILNLKKTIYTLGSINYQIDKWNIIPSYSFKYLKQIQKNLLFYDLQKKEDFLFEPSLLIRYRINNKSFVFSKVSLNQNPFSVEYLFQNEIFTNNRFFISNNPSLEIQKSKIVTLNYYNNDLYKQFFFNIGLTYQQFNGNFFSDIIINENKTNLNNFYLKENNNNFSINFSAEKFISILSSTLKINSTITNSNYKNVINQSELRNNINNIIINTFSIKTAFNTKVNFDNELTYNYSSNEVKGGNTINNKSISNISKIKYKMSDTVFSVISADYFIPNIENKKNSYLFVDFNVNFKPKNKKMECNLIGKNLLNHKIYSQIQTSDYSRITMQNNLISRYIFLNFTYNF